LPDSYRGLIGGDLPQVLSNIVIEGELSLPCQQENAHCREMCFGRRHVENRSRGEGNIVVQVRHTGEPFANELSIFVYAKSAPWRIWPVKSREKLIHTGSDITLGAGRRRLSRRY